MWFFIKMLLSAVFIGFVSWLSSKKIGLAGFLTALPLATLLALAFGQVEFNDPKQSVEYAKSIFYALPLTATFFIPFFFSEKFQLGFWTCYSLGIGFLAFVVTFEII